MDKAVFLDKDGTIIENVHYNVDPEKIRFLPEVPASLRLLKEQGFKLIVVSNQPGVAHGYFDEKELDMVWSSINNILKKENGLIDHFYYCPHDPSAKVEDYAIQCNCRKPKPGMLLKAADEQGIDLQKSWMIGDILHDVEAGNRAGCKTILINNGNETEWLLNQIRTPSLTVGKFAKAAEEIIRWDLQTDMV